MADEHDTPDLPASDEPVPQTAAPAPGAALREARSKKSLSLDELVVQTKLPLSVLQAMEADDFRTLNEPVYVRGYYRKYARVLGLDETPIIAGYEAHGGAVTRKPEVSLLVPDDPRPSSRWPLILGVVVLLAGLAAAANWYLSGQDDAEQSMAAPATTETAARTERPSAATRSSGNTRPPATAVATRPSEPTRQPVQSANERVDEPAEDEVAATDEPAVASTPAPRPEPSRAPPRQAPAPASAPNSLVLDFGDDSWVRVEDETGQRLLNGLVQGGQTRELSGVPPYNVFLGYAPGVSVRYQGEDVAVAPHTRGNNTARFTVR